MIVFDFEVFRYDWLVHFDNVLTGQSTTIINDADELQKYYDDNVDNLYVGYNNKGYDNYIYKVILQGGNPYEASKIIIEENDILKLFNIYNMWNNPIYSIDLMQDGMRGSLKEMEGYMGLDIDETTVPFDIKRPLTSKEIEQVVFYCKRDVNATKELFKLRMEDIKSKMDLVKYFELDKSYLDKTNAQLSAIILDAKDTEFDDELQPFKFEDLNIGTLDLKGKVFYTKDNIERDTPIAIKTIREYYMSPYDYDTQLVVDIAGVTHILRFGGLHGAIPNYSYQGDIWLADVASYYPSMMIEYDYLSRSVPDEMRSRFKEVYETRQVAKANNDKRLSNALKLFINTTYGGMKAKFNKLYDPRSANNVCVAGQTMLIDLILQLEPYITLIQSNTDGIVFIPHDKVAVKFVIDEWSKRTRMNMEITKCKQIHQKDVNNYILEDIDGRITALGAAVRQTTINGNRPFDIKRTGKIIDDAVVNYFINGIEPRETINNCHDLLDFQLIRKTGYSYDRTIVEYEGKDVEVQKVNRIYATIDSRWGKVYKVRAATKAKPARRDSHQSLPDHCYIANKNDFDITMLDREYYINQAELRIRQFKGE